MKRLIDLKVILVLVSVLIGGCASNYEYQGDNSAKLLLSGNSKNFWVEVYENRQCKKKPEGLRIATFYGPIKTCSGQVYPDTLISDSS